MNDDERVASCQAEIRRLRGAYREIFEEYERMKIIAYNAIVEGQITERLSHEDVLEALGITEEEFREIMEDKKNE